MDSNQKDKSPRRPTETDQELTKQQEPVEADSEESEQKPEAQPRPVERADLNWTDHED